MPLWRHLGATGAGLWLPPCRVGWRPPAAEVMPAPPNGLSGHRRCGPQVRSPDRLHCGGRGVPSDCGDAGPGEGGPRPGVGAVPGSPSVVRDQRRAHPGPAYRDLRHRPAHPRLGQVGRTPRPPAARRRPRVRRDHRGGRVERHRLRTGRGGVGRGPRGVRAVPPLPGRTAGAVRPHRRPGGGARRRLRRVRGAPHDQCVAPLGRDRPRRGRHLRPAGQRRPHRARVPGAGRGRAGERGRPHRADGHRRGPPCRGPPRGGERAQRRPPGAGPADGGHGGHRPGGDPPRRRLRQPGHRRGLRRGPRGVGQPGRPPVGDRGHGPRRGHRGAGPARPRRAHRRERGRPQDAHHPGDLRPGDVRDLVQDDGDAPLGARRPARASPTASISTTTRPPSPPPARATRARSS